MSLTESYKLHNKLWWNENDIRTFRVLDVPNTHADQIDRRQTLEETLALLRRELGNVIAHGISQWYFDMGAGGTIRLLTETSYTPVVTPHRNQSHIYDTSPFGRVLL